jgi:transposase
MTSHHDQPTQTFASIGIDIGKDVFHIVGFDTSGKVVLRKKFKRLALETELAKLPPSIVGLEACLSAHFVSRTLRRLGHSPRIIPAIYVKPFAKGQKNDYNDAEAIAEAALRPNLSAVREKTQDQLDLQALHRVRARLVSRRTATINQIRAFLIEHGIAVCTGAHSLRNSLFAILEKRADELSPHMIAIIHGLCDDWRHLDRRIEAITAEIEEISQKERNCRRLMTVPGIGPMISTAMVAAVGAGDAFERGARLRRLARSSAAAVLDRRRTDPRSHLQARQQVPAHALHPGGERHPDAAAELGEVQLRRLGHQCRDAHAPQ